MTQRRKGPSGRDRVAPAVVGVGLLVSVAAGCAGVAPAPTLALTDGPATGVAPAPTDAPSRTPPIVMCRQGSSRVALTAKRAPELCLRLGASVTLLRARPTVRNANPRVVAAVAGDGGVLVTALAPGTAELFIGTPDGPFRVTVAVTR